MESKKDGSVVIRVGRRRFELPKVAALEVAELYPLIVRWHDETEEVHSADAG